MKLALRITIFLTVFIMYLYDKNLLVTLLHQPLFSSINFLHILWFIFMGMMLKHLFPKEPFTMALLKSKKKKFVPTFSFGITRIYTKTKYCCMESHVDLVIR